MEGIQDSLRKEHDDIKETCQRQETTIQHLIQIIAATGSKEDNLNKTIEQLKSTNAIVSFSAANSIKLINVTQMAKEVADLRGLQSTVDALHKELDMANQNATAAKKYVTHTTIIFLDSFNASPEPLL